MDDMDANNTTETPKETIAPTTADNDGDGGILDQIEDGATNVFDEATVLTQTSPNDWTNEQIIGVAVGAAVVVLVLFILYWCCCKRRCGCCQQQQKHSKSIPKVTLHRPYVVRNPVTIPVDIQHNIPTGVKLHGGIQLRQVGLTGEGIKVAVIDSGIDENHPGFGGMIIKKKWYRYGTPLAEDDHGTHVAGTIHMMAPNAEIYDYRVFGDDGDLDGDLAIAQSIRDCIDIDGCHIINMSLRVSYPIVPEVRKAIKYAYSKNVIMVCAAGNSGDNNITTNEMYSYPALWDETISVAAVSKSNSNLPVAYFSESNPYIDYAGIGVDVTSFKPGGGYQQMSGTSMACPHVCGFITALMTNNKAKYSILKTLKADLRKNYAIDIGAEGKDNSTGVGFVTYLKKNEFDEFWTSEVAGGGGDVQAQVY